MIVILPPQLEAMVRHKVETGLYNNASEVVREALQLMEERDHLSRLRAAIAIGEEAYARGEFTTWGPDTMQRLRREAEEDERQGVPIDPDVFA